MSLWEISTPIRQDREVFKPRWTAILGGSLKTMIIRGAKHHEVLEKGGSVLADLVRNLSGTDHSADPDQK